MLSPAGQLRELRLTMEALSKTLSLVALLINTITRPVLFEVKGAPTARSFLSSPLKSPIATSPLVSPVPPGVNVHNELMED